LLGESSLLAVKLSALSGDDHQQRLQAVSSKQEWVKTMTSAVTLWVSSGEGKLPPHLPAYSDEEFLLFLWF